MIVLYAATAMGVGLTAGLGLGLRRWLRQRREDRLHERQVIGAGRILTSSPGDMEMRGRGRIYRKFSLAVQLERSPLSHTGGRLELSQWVAQSDLFITVPGAWVELRWSDRLGDPRVTAGSALGAMAPVFGVVFPPVGEVLVPLLIGLATGLSPLGFGLLELLGADLTSTPGVTALPVVVGVVLGVGSLVWMIAQRLGDDPPFVALSRFGALAAGPAGPTHGWITDLREGAATHDNHFRDLSLSVQLSSGSAIIVTQRVHRAAGGVACGGMAVELSGVGVPGAPVRLVALLAPGWRMEQLREPIRLAKGWTGPVRDPLGQPCQRYAV